jgi:hypothetical protein
MFNDARKSIQDEDRSGRPCVVREILKKVTDGASQVQNPPVNFRKYHALFSTRLSQSRLSQVLRKWVPKILVDAYRMASALTFF